MSAPTDFRSSDDILLYLENEIRNSESNITKLQNEIRISQLSFNKPITFSEEDQELLKIFDEPNIDSVEIDAMDLQTQVKEMEKTLVKLQRKIEKVHSTSVILEQKFSRYFKYAKENLPFPDYVPDETADELLQRIDQLLLENSQVKGDENVKVQNHINQNTEIINAINKKQKELKILQKLYKKEEDEMKQKIQAKRSEISKKEFEWIAKIQKLKDHSLPKK
ncbi:hypothetical protein GPJ56_004757 [Histomonas meleagridis]|uniref:uncharacterized protein n=1 Tax=Histomonas meleagridis TaxID=135588 RepID=UPI003559A2DA|nr:hypothetical protein GPJ56_004757 [Histomonas meleagridis]KAH0801655.1 hypothetical protein GO595_005490 [Histomonas meleagridis]